MAWVSVVRSSHAIPAGGGAVISGDLCEPPSPRGLIIFAHGSGSGRHSPRNQFVAEMLQQEGFTTLLADLLTPAEERDDQVTGRWRFDIEHLSARLSALIDWAHHQPNLHALPIGLFGASTGAAAALVTAANRRADVSAVVSRGGRPDLAGDALAHVAAPTLLIVGGYDTEVLALNYDAQSRLHCRVSVEVIAGATHLFEERGTLDLAAAAAARWFLKYVHVPAAAPASR